MRMVRACQVVVVCLSVQGWVVLDGGSFPRWMCDPRQNIGIVGLWDSPARWASARHVVLCRLVGQSRYGIVGPKCKVFASKLLNFHF